MPKVRDRSESGIKFNGSLIPPYLKRTQNIEEFLPWLYLRGISTGHCSESLKHLLGPGLSAASWEEVLTDLQQRGLKIALELANGDGALGFWKAVAKRGPETGQQRCWVHKAANVLAKLPKAMQPKVKKR